MIGICKHGFKILTLITLLILTSISYAHELQPSLLEIRQLSDEQHDISWRAPSYYNLPHPASLQLPERWQTTAIARPNHPWVEIVGNRTLLQVSADYMMLGIDHILSGFDHLASVLVLRKPCIKGILPS